MDNLTVLVFFVMTLTMNGCATVNEQRVCGDITAMCAALDKNRDGVIDKEEFLAGAKDPEAAERIFRQCDLNNDGVISMEEAQKSQKLLMRKGIMKREALRLTEPR
jgi:Ca2+-binding EF-hand superfamily protein